MTVTMKRPPLMRALNFLRNPTDEQIGVALRGFSFKEQIQQLRLMLLRDGDYQAVRVRQTNKPGDEYDLVAPWGLASLFS